MSRRGRQQQQRQQPTIKEPLFEMSDVGFTLQGWEAFDLAIRNGDADLVGALLLRSDVDPTDVEDAFGIACHHGYLEVIALLLDDGRLNPVAGAFDNEALASACRKNHLDVATVLLADERVNPATLVNGVFQQLCEKGRIKMVKLLLDDGRLDPTMNDNFAFILACEHGHLGMVNLLLSDPRINPTTLHSQCLAGAVKYGYLEVVKVLLADGRPNPAALDNTALSVACVKNLVDIARLLLEDPRVLSTINKTSLRRCYHRTSDPELKQLLMEHHANMEPDQKKRNQASDI